MSPWLAFLLGVIVGALLTIAGALVARSIIDQRNDREIERIGRPDMEPRS
jgi:hypothetical protein